MYSVDQEHFVKGTRVLETGFAAPMASAANAKGNT